MGSACAGGEPLLPSSTLGPQRSGPRRLSAALRQACLFGGAGEEGPLGDAWLLEGSGGGAAPRWRRAAAEAAAGRAWHAATPEVRLRLRLGRPGGAVSHELCGVVQVARLRMAAATGTCAQGMGLTG